MKVLRIRYSIRGLALVTAMISDGFAWYVTKVRPQERVVDSLLADGGWVAYGEFESTSDALQHIIRRENQNAWRGLFSTPTVVSLGEPDVHNGDTVCSQLAKLTSLREVYFDEMPITDAGLEKLAELHRLRTLTLYGSRATDAGLQHLSGLPCIENLDLCRTAVSDAGLGELAKLRTLKYVNLVETSVTAKGVEKFQQALPDCRILWGVQPAGPYGE